MFKDTGTVILFIYILFLVIYVVGLYFSVKSPKVGNYLAVEGYRGFRLITSKGVVVPFFEKYEELDGSIKTIRILSQNETGILTKDNYIIGLEVNFFIKIYPSFKDVRRISRSIGAENTFNLQELEKIFVPKFTKALIVAGTQFNAKSLKSNLDKFRVEVLENVERDLNGFALYDLTINYISTSVRKLEVK